MKYFLIQKHFGLTCFPPIDCIWIKVLCCETVMKWYNIIIGIQQQIDQYTHMYETILTIYRVRIFHHYINDMQCMERNFLSIHLSYFSMKWNWFGISMVLANVYLSCLQKDELRSLLNHRQKARRIHRRTKT